MSEKSFRVCLKKAFAVRENVLEAMEIPGDLAGRAPVITLTGSRQVRIENYSSIVFYNKEKLVVLTRCGKVCLHGKNLEITHYDSMEMEVKGYISGVFLEGKS